jgi:hypothetical protein
MVGLARRGQRRSSDGEDESLTETRAFLLVATRSISQLDACGAEGLVMAF